MLLLLILHSDTYKYVLNSCISSVSNEPLASRVCIDMYYTYKYILALLFVFLERKLLLFIIYLLLLYQSMIKYNNVNILRSD